jgi:hypothetical protein
VRILILESKPMNSDLPYEPHANRPAEPGAFTQEIRHQNISARVPEKVGRGVFSTGAIVLQGPHEFVVDFVVQLSQPQQVVARIVLAPSLMPSLISALRDNFQKYQAMFGTPPALPTPPPGYKPPPIDEVYDNLKLPEEVQSGIYANAVMIGHSASEFAFDFITNFYPRSAVSCRVYLSAPQIPRLLDTLTRSHQQYLQKIASQRLPPPPPGAAPSP